VALTPAGAAASEGFKTALDHRHHRLDLDAIQINSAASVHLSQLAHFTE
jgi:hypothetical protein